MYLSKIMFISWFLIPALHFLPMYWTTIACQIITTFVHLINSRSHKKDSWALLPRHMDYWNLALHINHKNNKFNTLLDKVASSIIGIYRPNYLSVLEHSLINVKMDKSFFFAKLTPFLFQIRGCKIPIWIIAAPRDSSVLFLCSRFTAKCKQGKSWIEEHCFERYSP